MKSVSHQELKQKPPIAFYNLLDECVQLELQNKSEGSQEELWIKMGTQLETSNFPKEKITVLVRQGIEDKIWERKFKDLEIPREAY